MGQNYVDAQNGSSPLFKIVTDEVLDYKSIGNLYAVHKSQIDAFKK
jgi:hypothetical protein